MMQGKAQATQFSYTGEFGWELTFLGESVSLLYKSSFWWRRMALWFSCPKYRGYWKEIFVHSHDFDSDINPIQAGLENLISWDKDFVGKNALLEFFQKTSNYSSVLLALMIWQRSLWETDRYISSRSLW